MNISLTLTNRMLSHLWLRLGTLMQEKRDEDEIMITIDNHKERVILTLWADNHNVQSVQIDRDE